MEQDKCVSLSLLRSPASSLAARIAASRCTSAQTEMMAIKMKMKPAISGGEEPATEGEEDAEEEEEIIIVYGNKR